MTKQALREIKALEAKMVWESLPQKDREWAMRKVASVMKRLKQSGVIE